MIKLVILDKESGAKKVVPLGEEPVTAGASIDCDLVLSGAHVAEHHCRFEWNNGVFRVTDLHSDTGTTINGASVGRGSFRPGDVIGIGRFEIRYEGFADNDTSAAPVEAASPRAKSNRVSKPKPVTRNAVRVRPPRESAAVAATVSQPKRRRKSGTGSKALFFVVAAGLLIVAAVLANEMFGKREPADGNDLGQQLKVVFSAADDGRYEDALQVLSAVETTHKGDAYELERIAKTQRKIADQQRRFERARQEFQQARSLFESGDVEAAIRRLDRVAKSNADLVKFQETASTHLAEWDKHRTDRFAQYQGLLSGSTTITDVADKVETFLSAEEYAHALLLSSSYRPKDEDERRQLESLQQRVEQKAETAGRKILHLVNQFVDDGELFVALNHLADQELKHLRGTVIWYRLLDRADEIEDLIDETVPKEARPVARRTHQREPDEEAILEEIARTPVKVEELEQKADPLVMAEQAIRAYDLDGAGRWLDRVLTSESPWEQRQKASALLHFVERPKTLAKTVVEAFQQRKPSNLPVLQLTTGETAKFVASDGEMLTVAVGDSERQIHGLELSVDSLLKASARVPLDPEGFLNRAFVALLAADDKTFYRCIDDAAADPELKPVADVAIAYQKGMDQVPPRGFEMVGGEWLTFAEAEQRRITMRLQQAIEDVFHGAPEEGYEAIREIRAVYPDLVAGLLVAARDQVYADVEEFPEREKLDRIRQQRARLDEARKAALDLIYDEEKYFYPYRPPECPAEKAKEYPAVQREVDERVQAVREIWGDEFSEYQSYSVKISRETHQLLRKVHQLHELLRKFSVGVELKPELREFLLLPVASRHVDLRNFALTEEERLRIDKDRTVIEFNAEWQDKLDQNEWQQIVITNDYRVMMGRRRLAYNEKIHQAAKWHSNWMSKKGLLAHYEEDNPKRRTPRLRMKMEGYDKGAGENCSVGSPTAMGAHLGWARSSGHHRNMLWTEHTEMACALVGAYWTQNFGGGSEYTGNLED